MFLFLRWKGEIVLLRDESGNVVASTLTGFTAESVFSDFHPGKHVIVDTNRDGYDDITSGEIPVPCHGWR